jgi:hypothetical protein
MNLFLVTCTKILQFSAGAKIATAAAIVLKSITPPSFPFFQAHWLFVIALAEIAVTSMLLSQNRPERIRLLCVYFLSCLFLVVHVIFHFAKIDACPCLGVISTYNGAIAIIIRFGLFISVVYMLGGSSWYLSYGRKQ